MGKISLREKVNRANKRLETMRKKGLGDLSVIPLAMKEHAKITGKKTDIFEIPKNAGASDLKRIENQIDKFLKSKWTSQQGRAEIYRKRLETFETKEKLRLSKSQTLKFIDIVNTDIYSKLKELGVMDSDQIVELVREKSNKKLTTFEKAFNKLYEHVQENPNFKSEDMLSYVEREFGKK